MTKVSPHMLFQEALKANGLDAAFLFKPENVRYLSGYASVCSGVLAGPDGEAIFCTLWLDGPEARRFCLLPRVDTYIFPGERLGGKMIELLRKHRPTVRRLGVEHDYLVLRDFLLLSEAFPQAEFVNITPIVDLLRAIKTDDELDKMKQAARIADRAMEAALECVRPGVEEIEVAAEAEYVMRKLGSVRPAFGTFVASGERTLLAHPHASRRKIKADEPVVIDLGASWEGYASDICRTTFTGGPTIEQADYLKLVLRAQSEAAALLSNGAVCGDVFHAAFRVFQEKKLGHLLPDDVGYGVGLRQSEFYPIIEKDSPTVLKKNMVVALLQTTGYSRKLGGLRVEDTFHITVNGSERLTKHIQQNFD